MPQQMRMVWKAKVAEPEPTEPTVVQKSGGSKGKEKGKKAKHDPEPVDVAYSKSGSKVDPHSEVVSEGRSSRRKGARDDLEVGKGKKGDDKGGKAKGKGKEWDGGSHRGPREEEPAGRKGGSKGKGKGKDGGGKNGKGRSGGSPGNAKTVQELESEMVKKREHDFEKRPLETDGEHCQVKKHSGMGCAVITMSSPQVRDAALKHAEAQLRRNPGDDSPLTVEINGIEVQVKPHTDKVTKREIHTDIFAAWGHQVERRTPLEALSIANFFDGLHEKLSKALEAPAQPSNIAKASAHGQTLSTAPLMGQTFSNSQAPPPPPAHVPKVGQILTQSAAFVQPQPSPQHQQQQSVFPEQQYQYWLQQQQYAAQQAAAQQQYQAQQQQYLLAQQQQYHDQFAYQQQYAAQQSQFPYDAMQTTPPKKLPQPLQIKDPKSGSVIDTLGMNFKKREPSSPQPIIDPDSGNQIGTP